MTLRNASGKFSLPTFGRRSHDNAANSQPRQSSSTYSSGAGQSTLGQDSEPASPNTTDYGGSHRGEGTGGGMAFEALGSKLGKKIAHTSLLPSLGNQDLRELQDVITAEKAVMQTTDKLGGELRTAATRLPAYCKEGKEGPDLQDVLGHSATLLAHLADAFYTFAGRESSMRDCFKRIRAREEALEEFRRKRRATASKAEAAERKLAKMGPENKQLYQQTELLERLRSEMRQMDSDIVHEESRIGDFKRQTVKEAMSYKFGGLEELGEKMCIIGELGKLLLEEIPLEETPPGYGRAPYTAYERTNNTTQEALKCLSTVQFHPASTEPKPPGLPGLQQSGTLTPPRFPRQDSARNSDEHTRQHSLTQPTGNDVALAHHEAYGDYPPGAMSPASTTKGVVGAPQLPALDSAYGGVENDGTQHRYSEFGASPEAAGTVNYKGPPVDDHADVVHDYEYEQQREIDEQRQREEEELPAEPESAIGAGPGWQPLKVRHSQDYGNTGTTLHDGPAPQVVVLQDAPPRGASLQDNGYAHSQTSPSLNINSDAFEPLSFERNVQSRTSAYYSPDPSSSRDEDNRTPVPPAAAAAVPAPQAPGPPPATEEFQTPQSSPRLHATASPVYDGIAKSTSEEDTYRHSRPFSHLPSPSQIHDEELPSPPPVPSLPPAAAEEHSTPPPYGVTGPPALAPVAIPADSSAYAEEQEATPVVSIPAQRAPDRYIPPVAPPAPELDPTASLVSDADSFYGSNRGSLAPSIATTAPSHYTRDSYAPTHDSHASNGNAMDIPDVPEIPDIPVVTIPAERSFQPVKASGGKISAAAFRRPPRSSVGTTGSTDEYDPMSPTTSGPMGPRRLPQPPAPTQQAAVPSTPSPRSSWEAAPPYAGDDLR